MPQACVGLGGASGSDSEETPNWGLSESLTPEVALHRRGTSQLEMFDLYGKPALDQALAGYNVTLMVYGQTGSGKTFTMMQDGVLGDSDAVSVPEPGPGDTAARCPYNDWQSLRCRPPRPDAAQLVQAACC